MQLIRGDDLTTIKQEFQVIAGTDRSQIAAMNIAPAHSSGEFGSEHPKSDQVMLVLAGEASVRVGETTVAMKTGDMILIAAGEPHQVRNAGLGELRTVNFYAPPAYDEQGEPLT